MKKREANRLKGVYLIEHDPENEKQPYSVWDLRHIFSTAHSSFYCATLTEAEDLVERLIKIKDK